jgi:multicomponent Na+:H+ antiporter subunit D
MIEVIVLPILIPLATAALSLLYWRSRQIQRILGVVGAAGLFAASLWLLFTVRKNGIIATQIGGWEAPFGITLVADLFSAIMVALTGLMGLAIAVYSLGSIDGQRDLFGYYPLLNILLMGVSGAFLTGDIFNLYVWFEVMLIASFVLLSLGGEKAQIEGAFNYVTLNLLSSALFLAAVGILYGMVGTLNMADLSIKLRSLQIPGLATVLAMLFFIAFGIKAAMFPLFFWLPASYHTPPVAVSALFAGLLTKVGVYSLIRVFTLLFLEDVNFTHNLILVVAGLTMVTGVLGAVAQYDFRRLLSFHIVSQIGYLLMGLGLFTVSSLAGAVYFMAHVILAKSTLFLVSGVVQRLEGTYELKRLGGLYAVYPMLAILFMIPALSLAGIPPLSGFFAKLALVQAGLAAQQYAIVATALGVSVLTLFSMIKIWTEAFWKPLPEAVPLTAATPYLQRATSRELSLAQEVRRGNLQPLVLPIVALALVTVVIGLFAEPFFNLALQAAEQLMNPALYIEAVLGGPA